MKKTLFSLLASCFTSVVIAQGTQINSSPIYYLNGKVGIGNSSPSSTLHINTYSSTALRFTRALANEFGYEIGGTTFGLYDYANSKYMWRTDNGNVLLVESSGNVGIGISNPSGKFQSYISSSRYFGHNVNGADLSVLSDNNTAPVFKVVGTGNADLVNVFDSSSEVFTILDGGNVGIGTTTPNNKLEVNGTIRSQKVKVEATGWPDFVFAPNFKLRTLNELEAYIKANQHLPEVPSAKEVEEHGLDLGKMDATLLQKVEELTLYLIEINKKVERLEKENQELKKGLRKN